MATTSAASTFLKFGPINLYIGLKPEAGSREPAMTGRREIRGGELH